ncbi:MAG TPA: hypothetical protein VIR03_04185 [Candidatus Saccharimonadales bacterium]
MFGHDDQMQQNASAITPTDQDLGAAATAPAVGNDAGEYIDSDSPMPAGITSPSGVMPSAAAAAATAPVASADDTAPAALPDVVANANELLGLKQQALQQLSPLVGHLDQTPEEKFRTTMMMIQAADNADLIKTAYDAALQIPDEKVRAQALLDIVNEINYFTHNTGEAEA